MVKPICLKPRLNKKGYGTKWYKCKANISPGSVAGQKLPLLYSRQHGGLPPGFNQSKKSSTHEEVG